MHRLTSSLAVRMTWFVVSAPLRDAPIILFVSQRACALHAVHPFKDRMCKVLLVTPDYMLISLAWLFGLSKLTWQDVALHLYLLTACPG